MKSITKSNGVPNCNVSTIWSAINGFVGVLNLGEHQELSGF
ncbi:MAG: hypothetical protein SGI74_14040 [Oligoflexia bacterium]|nr:hypothetical protein [Oligoflexia bacterium]